MKDPYWRAVHRAILPRLTGSDIVLAPRGDWAPFPCAVRLYDSIVPCADETVLILHKGRLAGLPKPALAAVLSGWRCLFANAVFVVFVRGRRRTPLRWRWPSDHVRLLRHYLRSRQHKILPSTVYYVHMPKAGGTAVWDVLSRLFASKVYYSDVETFRALPPPPGDYDLVGLHGPAWPLLDVVRPGDLVAGLIRDPVERFLSAVVHSRRENEDAATLRSSQSAMRGMPADDFLTTPAGRYEATLQLSFLGGPVDASGACAALAAALAFVARDDAIFAPTGQSQLFVDMLLRRLGMPPQPLPRRNENRPEDYARSAAEFAEAMPRLLAMTAEGRALFEAVSAQFEARVRRDG